MSKRKTTESQKVDNPIKKRKLDDKQKQQENNHSDDTNEEDEYEENEKLTKTKNDKSQTKDTKKDNNENDDNESEFKFSADQFKFEVNTSTTNNNNNTNAFDGFGDFGGFGSLSNSQNDKKNDNKETTNNNSKNEEFNFDNWGTQENGITFSWDDFDPKSFGSEQIIYTDQNNFETNNPVAVLNGEQLDTGDKNDKTEYETFSTIYVLILEDDKQRYSEKGKGIIKLNTYKDDKNDKKTKARLLCRREKVLSTIINIGLFKKMEFKKVNDSFLRFSVLENNENNNETDKNNDNDDEDDDLKETLVTYLIKPKNKNDCDVLLGEIKRIQEML